jgi:hypothetical protein
MERGQLPQITVYTFEVPEGEVIPYPDGERYTLDHGEATEFAAGNGYLLIENTYEYQDSGLLEDHTPEHDERGGPDHPESRKP